MSNRNPLQGLQEAELLISDCIPRLIHQGVRVIDPESRYYMQAGFIQEIYVTAAQFYADVAIGQKTKMFLIRQLDAAQPVH